MDDEVRDVPRARIFDPLKHCLNPLTNIDYKKARELADALYTASPQGEATLTVRNGKRALLQRLVASERLDKIEYEKDDEEVQAMIDDLLASPVLKRMLCNPTNFSFNPRSVILARVNRKELGDFDSKIIVFLLLSHYTGQVVLPDGGFYLREAHISLIREGRLIVGLNHLSELSPKIRNAVLLMEEKSGQGATFDDASTLAQYAKLIPNTNEFNSFVHHAMT